jgi:hypothetical protein
MLVAVSSLAAFAGIPLPEHPRPDWERAEWVNLNGEWDFGFAPDRLDKRILVPFGWGSPLSGVKDEGDTGYYRRDVVVPESWKGKRVFLVIGASDHDTTVAFAGKELGTYVGGYVPFEFELTDLVEFGKAQELKAKVYDPPAEKARAGHYLYGKQGYGNARGFWQTVYLEARGRTYLDSVRFVSDIAAKKVKATLSLGENAESEVTASVEVDGKTFSATFAKGESVKEIEIALAEPKLWSIESPHLYDAVCRAGDDVVKSYFGFREIGVGMNPNGDNYITLNGKPVYLQLALDQSYHPEGWYTFPSDEFMKNEILISKKLALNGNRVHIKIEVPRKLYWADRLGLLIQADVPCAWGDVTWEMFAEHWKAFEAMVKRDFNHPSIYQWTLFNETWGLFTNRSLEMGLAAGAGGKKKVFKKWSQEAVRASYKRAKELDTTRIIEDNSPCYGDHVESDVNTWHAYRAGYNWESTVANAVSNTYAGSKWNYIGGNAQRGEPMMNSECGNVWGYKGSTGDCDFSWDYHMMINAFRRHLECAGWLYTEHHDVINEWNGYVRFDRSEKFDGMDELAGMKLADLHRDAAIYFAGTPSSEIGEAFGEGAGSASFGVGVSFVTDAYAGKKLSLERSTWYFDGEGARREEPAVAESGTFVAKSWHCETLWNVAVRLPAAPACGCVVFVLKADGKEIARNFWSFAVNSDGAAKVKPVSAQWSDGAASVMEGLKENGFGKGEFVYELPAPAEGGIFRAELSAKRWNGKDRPKEVKVVKTLDFMLGGGSYDRSLNPNSYPQTSTEKHPANLKVYAADRLIAELKLPDDPADHRGILSWFAQKRDLKLVEAGSYGWLVEAAVPASAVKNGKVRIRLESDAGLAVYGRLFGRYPLDPHVSAK